MKTITINTVYEGKRLLPLGRQGENEALQIVFDVSQLITDYGEGTAVLVAQRSQDVAPYTIVTTQSDKTVTWTISSTDTLYQGVGKANLMWNVNNTIAKTIDFDTYVFPSISGIVTVPDALESWYNEMLEYINSIAVDDSKIEEVVNEYLEEHPIEAPVTSVNEKTGAVVLTSEDVGALSEDELNSAINTALAQAKASGDFDGADGQNGENGYSPTVSMTPVNNGTKIDITDVNGVHTATILNGVNGTNGTNGTDGFSPIVEVTQTSTGHTVSITDKEGTQTFDVLNGINGTNGQDGQDGADGQDGQDLIHMGETVTASGVVSKELSPNVFCLFTDTQTGISDLTLTLASGEFYDEYMCAFTTSASGCNLSLPNTVSYIGSVPTLEANTYYELSIVNNKAVIA